MAQRESFITFILAPQILFQLVAGEDIKLVDVLTLLPQPTLINLHLLLETYISIVARSLRFCF